MEDYIEDFTPERDFKRVYGDEVKQLVFKNNHIPDGITIIGTDESIRLFLDVAFPDTDFGLAAAGFYEFSVKEAMNARRF